MNSNVILEVRRLTKSYPNGNSGTLTVVKDISFSLVPGSTCAILGPSGSGKTTLLGLCAGLDQPTSLLADRSRRVLVTEATRVRSIERDGKINTVAGGGTNAPSDGLLATSAALSGPSGMAIDHAGGLILATTNSNQLWTLQPAR